MRLAQTAQSHQIECENKPVVDALALKTTADVTTVDGGNIAAAMR